MVVSSPQWGENRAFFQFFPWRNLWLRHFAGYPFGASRKKHQPFSLTQLKKSTHFCNGNRPLTIWNSSYFFRKPSKRRISRIKVPVEKVPAEHDTGYSHNIKSGCVIGNGWCPLPWNSKRIANKMPLAGAPNRKTEEKTLSLPCGRDETPLFDDRA